jgi:hypothetical protein
MNEHEMDREIQELRSRVGRIEASFGVKRGCGCVDGDRGASRHDQSTGGTAATKPIQWKLKKGDHLPPFLSSLIRVPIHPAPIFDDPPQQ